ncbi:MAG: DUF1003 domain-containing protein [Bacteroidota bacterium]|nr:DUF1003 domain-containing protein [Bacteroidota bacterium]MDP4229259.1 DUF1003 domain-containing protein [Bacteroidota bacterium]MDP4237715.1 DUF1003 domain-containing protein [Bacteroidota bacterium]
MPSILKSTADISIRFFRKSFEQLGILEQNVIKTILEGVKITKNTNKVFSDQMTFGQRVADKVAAFGGSWTFILIFGSILLIWVLANSFFLAQPQVFDPYPYILLNLFLSMIAALQAPVIMMSQNRQAARDRLEANNDYQVNLKSELEILELHRKVDTLREEQWAALVEMQNRQIELLQKLLESKS